MKYGIHLESVQYFHRFFDQQRTQLSQMNGVNLK